jgi:hypothetical protein
MVFFIKYEFWPNYLKELKNQNIPTYLISGIFRENQLFFKWYGGFYRKALQSIDYFFVQNESSKELIKKIGFNNVKISGDTRFDRVAAILNQNNELDFIDSFKNNQPTIVVGSSWPKDETLLVNFINNASDDIKFIIENDMSYLLKFLEGKFIEVDYHGYYPDTASIPFKKFYFQKSKQFFDMISSKILAVDKERLLAKTETAYDFIIDVGNVLHSRDGDVNIDDLETVVNSFSNSLKLK